MSSNLPPGVSVNDIPGNRPEDQAWEEAYLALYDMLESGFSRAEIIDLLGDAEAGLEVDRAAEHGRKKLVHVFLEDDCERCGQSIVDADPTCPGAPR